ncbi:MAG: hypothetical protein IPI45_02615 [Saprospiraceae bacterium]|nr:hypothetical protein [Saprospiraceae bacterium]MBK7736648.1 hypothetical protein [Saprospiraceae bacterium]MBK7911988.1 hypothetical protein [Saprospiraceae bacterium]
MNTSPLHAFLLLIVSLTTVSQTFADFSLVCPPDVTVSCREDYLHDLNVYGKAYTDYNGIIQFQHDCKTTIEIDDCGKGTIKRVWGVENPENWKWLSCTQVITISNATGFGYADITWPQSLIIRACNPQNELKNLQAPYDKPSWERPKCSKPMVSYKDTRFRVDEGCEKIVREWKILDWCQYDPINYPGRGVFSYTQVIKLISVPDTLALLCEKDTVVLNNRTCDTLYVKLDSAIFQSSCPVYHKIYNTSKYAINSGADASGYYPNGITKFFYIAEYACGTEIKCEVTVDVRNKILPTPYCLTGVILTLMPVDQNQDGTIDEGMIDVWASDLDKGSWHSCPGQKLNFSFSKDGSDRSRTYTCKDVGIQDVEIWVTDTLGNQDVCKTSIEIQNNNPAIPNCDGNLTGGKRSLKGQVLFYNTPSPGLLQLKLIDNQQIRETMLHANNQYQYAFDDLNSKMDYTLILNCMSKDEQAIDYNDLNYLRKIINGQIIPTSPYAYFAADINSDQEINQLDYNLLRRVINARNSQLIPNIWKYISSDYVFKNSSNPLAEIHDFKIPIDVHHHDLEKQAIVAIRTGNLINPVEKKSDLEDRNNEQSKESFELLQLNYLKQLNAVEWQLNSSQALEIELNCFGIDGKILYNSKHALTKGINTIQVQLPYIGLGLYQIRSTSQVIAGKMILSK